MASSSQSDEPYHPGIPSSYVEFVTQVLGVKLSPGQWVMATVCFDGAEPSSLTGAAREVASAIFGPVDEIPKSARRTVAALVGARSGKSFLFSLRLLHLALVTRFTLSAGEHAFGLLVAPNLKLAKQAFRYITGAIHSAAVLEEMLINETAESVTVGRPDGKPVTIECLPATHGGTAVRGRKLFGAVLDEASFFRDSNFVINDKDVADAISARVVSEGQFIMSSTPWTEAGLLYERFKQNHGKPITALSVHAPTELLRSDDKDTLEMVRLERINDPAKASLEYDAIPLGADTTKFFDPAIIEMCVDPDMPEIVIPTGLWQDTACGLDTGFRRDPSAAVIVRALNRERSIVAVAECIEIRPANGEKLKPSETIDALLDRARYHECNTVIADQHYVELVRERCPDISMREAPPGIGGVAEVYVAARTAMKEGRVRISPHHVKLLNQLKDVVSKPTPGGNISITSPRRGGSHGDLVSAFVLGVWAAVNAGSTVGEITSGASILNQARRVTDGYGATSKGRNPLDMTIEERLRADNRKMGGGGVKAKKRSVWG